ncbi:Uma2 family endonuclease [Kitasatospora sp. NPDC048365]|uniref:Uma2 family endonuclease n=1 Tax=Kitasatospora sp. NPDC048365 TaxID=3364050 RepID=UPI003714D5D0
MTAMSVEPGRQWDYLLNTWLELDVPEGWRAEIDEGEIRLVPPPNVGHNVIAGKVHRALLECLPPEVGVYQTLGTEIVPLEKLYVPDLVVVDDARLVAREASIDAAGLLMAVEITSKRTARLDRTKKLWAYGHAPVPLFLLVDRFDEDGPTVTVFSDPDQGRYQRGVRTPFGQPVELPEPFGIELSTEGFPAAK